MSYMKTLHQDLEQSCFEALDDGLIGDDIVNFMVRDNSYRHSNLSADDLREYADKVYNNITDTLIGD